jgi:hypothetical protein
MHRGYWSAIGGLGTAIVFLGDPLFKMGTAYGVGLLVGVLALAIYLTIAAPAVNADGKDSNRQGS